MTPEIKEGFLKLPMRMLKTSTRFTVRKHRGWQNTSYLRNLLRLRMRNTKAFAVQSVFHKSKVGSLRPRPKSLRCALKNGELLARLKAVEITVRASRLLGAKKVNPALNLEAKSSGAELIFR
jgi:hypothetical protein